ncbi:MAG: RipA family octameric membrane protein [Candidatus Loosdrechtia sp.]|uniref:RipA family octameric membrane protein n=1 Tax=Candidatus Loosdrechtia sp. TaxID=3101272 RepID=UPI003A74EACB|nr:MAG: hypothetical protein QY305_08380 [Candidatus Jettenia sp. AMX2]
MNGEDKDRDREKEKDYEAYKTYIQLWKDENPIKTHKLQVLLIVNGILVSAIQIAGGFEKKNWFLFLAGVVFSCIWVLSIGRTSLFQKVWQIKAKMISDKYPSDQRFDILHTTKAEKGAPSWLKALGSFPSKYYLLGAPLLFSLLWLASLLYVLINK